jgi:hypothetical protein
MASELVTQGRQFSLTLYTRLVGGFNQEGNH